MHGQQLFYIETIVYDNTCFSAIKYKPKESFTTTLVFSFEYQEKYNHKHVGNTR